MHEVLVNRLGGLSLPRKSVVRLTDRPDMTLDVYRGRKTTIQQVSTIKPVLSIHAGEGLNKYPCILDVIILLCNNPVTLLIRATDKRGVIKRQFLLFFNENICCDHSLESSQRDGSKDGPQNMLFL